MTEDEVVALETEAIRAVRAAFEAIEAVASGRMSRESARDLFEQCLSAHDLARAARDGMRQQSRHRHAVSAYRH
jgi:hypothetical protein